MMSEIKSPNALGLKSEYDCYFSNGIEYTARCDRGFFKGKPREEYYSGFTDRDYLLDAAINKGNDLRLGCNLWRIYDDAMSNYGLNPIDPYNWLFEHAMMHDKTIVVSQPNDRFLALSGTAFMAYYDYIHGMGMYVERHLRPIEPYKGEMQ